MKYIVLFILVIIINSGFVYSQSKVSGKITDTENKPVYGANVVIEGTIDGATSDENGIYEFTTQKTGRFNLIVTAMGLSEKIVIIDINPGQDLIKDVKLTADEVKTEEIVVTASSFTSGENSKVTLTPLEIVRIPGADADLFRALTTFPGTNQVDEGSRISVRGGDPDEVLTILDQATLYNPFIFDNTYNTSSYSTIEPWGLRGINFTSGGFSAKFGNALSGVLDLKSYEMTRGRGMFLLAGIGASSLAGVWTSNDGMLGATFQANQSYLKPFFDLNGMTQEYSKVPEARGFGGTIAHKFSKTGYMKFYANYSGDRIGILSESPSFKGFYNSTNDNFFANYKVSFAPTAVSSLSAGVSFSAFDRKQDYGVLDSRNQDYYGKFRVDFSNPLTSKIEFNAGAEYEYSNSHLSGTYPLYFYDIAPDSRSEYVDTKNSTGRVGAYAEGLFRISDKFFAISGVRTDYHTLSKNINIDPRLSIGYQLNSYNAIRGAIGLYHQYPSLSQYQRTTDNNLYAESAIHYILGYEFNKENDIVFRVEGYYKDYRDLVTAFQDVQFPQQGNGFAKGIDVFLKGKIQNKLTAWISYAYSDSKRRRFDGGELYSSNYDITHNMSIVSSYNITNQWTVGASYKLSTGKPYTPVVSSIFDPVNDVYIPIYAQENSDRFPTYSRIDLNLQYITSLFDKFAVFFVALNNLLDTKNLYLISYNRNYTEKIEIRSNNKRIIYFGVGLQL